MDNEVTQRHLLIVENDPNDAFLIRRAFNNIPDCGTCFVCRNTSEARAYLSGAGIYADRAKYPVPAAVLSDVRMPGETGVELMRWIKSQETLASIPVIILTGSASPSEMEAARSLGASKILRKPVRLEEFEATLQEVARIICADKRNC